MWESHVKLILGTFWEKSCTFLVSSKLEFQNHTKCFFFMLPEESEKDSHFKENISFYDSHDSKLRYLENIFFWFQIFLNIYLPSSMRWKKNNSEVERMATMPIHSTFQLISCNDKTFFSLSKRSLLSIPFHRQSIFFH